MTDIHCHIIPSADDGAQSLGESLKMASIAAEGNTKGLVCTPHCNIPGEPKNYYTPALDRVVELLQQELDSASIPLRLYPGQEVFLREGVGELIRRGKVTTLNRSRYLLAELDPSETLDTALTLLKEVRSTGLVPVLAHPERCGFVREDPASAKKLASLALLQVNKDSFFGLFGRDTCRAANEICRMGLADLAASDGHSPYRRTPNLGDLHELLCESFSPDYADLLLISNPEKIISDGVTHKI